MHLHAAPHSGALGAAPSRPRAAKRLRQALQPLPWRRGSCLAAQATEGASLCARALGHRFPFAARSAAAAAGRACSAAAL